MREACHAYGCGTAERSILASASGSARDECRGMICFRTLTTAPRRSRELPSTRRLRAGVQRRHLVDKTARHAHGWMAICFLRGEVEMASRSPSLWMEL
jgi:hypothetical protein